MPIAERIRENAERRRQREVILKRMEASARPQVSPPHVPATQVAPKLSVSVERTRPPQRSARRRKQWTFHFSITISVPTFSRQRNREGVSELRYNLSQRYAAFGRRMRRRTTHFKDTLYSLAYIFREYQRARARKKAMRAVHARYAPPLRKELPPATPSSARRTGSSQPAQYTQDAPTIDIRERVIRERNQQRSGAHAPRQGSHGAVACPMCRTETVSSRWQGHEAYLRFVGVSVRRCPRCLHRFYCEPLALRPLRKAVVAWSAHQRVAKKRPLRVHASTPHLPKGHRPEPDSTDELANKIGRAHV